MTFVFIISSVLLIFILLHFLSYNLIKNNILNSQKWDMNICSGKTDGGGLNVDIMKHTDVNNLLIVDDIYNLPFHNKEFESVLCSHTMEHVDYPRDFFNELTRVGQELTVVIPPLYDLFAVCNFLEHKWIFLTFRKKHINKLPRYIKLPFSGWCHKKFKQVNNA